MYCWAWGEVAAGVLLNVHAQGSGCILLFHAALWAGNELMNVLRGL